MADAGVETALIGASSLLMTAGDALFDCSPLACGAALVALNSCVGALAYKDTKKAFVMAVAANSAAYVMSSFAPLSAQAITAAAGLAIYRYAR